MTYFAAYVTLTLFWHPTPDVALAAGPEVLVYRDDRQVARLEPLTLTWTPDAGFGAQTEVTLAP